MQLSYTGNQEAGPGRDVEGNEDVDGDQIDASMNSARNKTHFAIQINV